MHVEVEPNRDCISPSFRQAFIGSARLSMEEESYMISLVLIRDESENCQYIQKTDFFYLADYCEQKTNKICCVC